MQYIQHQPGTDLYVDYVLYIILQSFSSWLLLGIFGDRQTIVFRQCVQQYLDNMGKNKKVELKGR